MVMDPGYCRKGYALSCVLLFYPDISDVIHTVLKAIHGYIIHHHRLSQLLHQETIPVRLPASNEVRREVKNVSQKTRFQDSSGFSG